MNIEEFESRTTTKNRLRRRLTDIMIGASVLRNVGFAGATQIARDYLAQMDLGRFADVSDEDSFLRLLDECTEELRRRLVEERLASGRPPKSRNAKAELWGSARKALNVFLCEAYFNRVLNRCYGLQKLGPWLETTLDGIVSKTISEKARKKKWDTSGLHFSGVIHLDEATSREFQQMARRLALCEGWQARIYFEVFTWPKEYNNSQL